MVREELFWAKRVPCERLEAPYEAYRLDYGQFKTLFCALSPWGKGDYAEAITARIFKVFFKLYFFYLSMYLEKQFTIKQYFSFILQISILLIKNKFEMVEVYK